MAAPWFVQKNGQQHGPFSDQQLLQLAASGQLQQGDLVCQQGMASWSPAGSVPGLFAAGPAQQAGFTPAGFQGGAFQPYASPQSAEEGYSKPRRKRSAVEKVIYPTSFQSLLRVGAIILGASLFVPWWSMSFAGMQFFDMRNLNPEGHFGRGKDWYVDHAGEDAWKAQEERFDKLLDDDSLESTTIWLWGWHTKEAMLATVFGLLIGVLIVLEATVDSVRRFGWVFWFISAALAVPVVIVGLKWLTACPQAKIEGMTQTFFAGPFLAAGGGALVIVGGLVCGVIGLMKR